MATAKARTLVYAKCFACGERGQETYSDQWDGSNVPPWHGGKPRCGFCSATLSVDPQQTRRTSEDPVEPVKRAKR